MTDIRRTLSALGWVDHDPALLPDDWNSDSEPIDTEHTPAKWKAIVSDKCTEILEEQARHQPANSSIKTGSAIFAPNDVHVVNKSYII